MRAPAYQMYAAEWLADEQVTLLSIAAEGVYIRLLNFCWREGSIPSNPAHLAPLCKYTDVKVIKEAVALFTKSPGQPGRLIHKRLEEEREKQQAFKDKQVINGKLGGRPRKPNDNPDESQTKGLGYSGLTQTEPKKRSSTSSSFTSATPTSVGGEEAPDHAPALKAEKAKREQAMAAHTDPDYLQNVDESPLVKPDAFAAILRATGYPNLDAERYRLQIAAKSEGVRRTSSQWRSRIIEFVNNDYTAGKLLTHPVLTPNEVPGNWDTTRQGAYTAPMGQGIPHPSSYLKPDFTPR